MSDAKTELENFIAKHEILNDLTIKENELFIYLWSAKDNFVSSVVLETIVNESFNHLTFFGINYDKDALTFNFVKHVEK